MLNNDRGISPLTSSPIAAQNHGRPAINLIAPSLIKLLDGANNAVSNDPGTAQWYLVQALTQLQSICPSANRHPSPQPRRGGLAPWQVSRVKMYIETHLESPIKVTDLAAASRLSVRCFSTALRQSVGLPPKAFILVRRIEHAQMLMSSTEQALTDIALACGFYDQAHFCRWFRRVNGCTPKAWRRQHFVMPIAAGHS